MPALSAERSAGARKPGTNSPPITSGFGACSRGELARSERCLCSPRDCRDDLYRDDDTGRVNQIKRVEAASAA